MKQKWLIILLVFVMLAGAAAVFYLWNKQFPRRFNWRDDNWVMLDHREDGDQPYDVRAFYQFLENTQAKGSIQKIKNDLLRDLPLESSVRASYLFIGNHLFLDSAQTDHLVRFVEMGNTACIVSKRIDSCLIKQLYSSDCWLNKAFFDTYTDAQVSVAWTRSAQATRFNLHYAVQNQTRSYDYTYFNVNTLCFGHEVQVLSTIHDSLPCCLEFRIGKGRLLLHSIPLAFANYTMLQPACRNYIQSFAAQIPKGPIYWDVADKLPRQDFPKEAPSPLAYMLQQRSLAWAWYLLCTLILLYVVFRGKRRQRVIPVLPPVENSSYEYLGTIAHLHFRAHNFRWQCTLMMRLFLAQIRERYGLHVVFDPQLQAPLTDAGFYTRLSQVSGQPEQKIRLVFDHYARIRHDNANERDMVMLHREISNFWSKTTPMNSKSNQARAIN